jgi:hypothetical protein
MDRPRIALVMAGGGKIPCPSDQGTGAAQQTGFSWVTTTTPPITARSAEVLPGLKWIKARARRGSGRPGVKVSDIPARQAVVIEFSYSQQPASMSALLPNRRSCCTAAK